MLLRRTPVRVDRNAVHSPQPEDLDQLCQPATPRNIGLKDMHAALLCDNTQHTVRFICTFSFSFVPSLSWQKMIPSSLLRNNKQLLTQTQQRSVSRTHKLREARSRLLVLSAGDRNRAAACQPRVTFKIIRGQRLL